MDRFKKYRKTQIGEMRPYIQGESMENISITPEDFRSDSPKLGDMIARDPNNHKDQWLVSEKFFNNNYELATDNNESQGR